MLANSLVGTLGFDCAWNLLRSILPFPILIQHDSLPLVTRRIRTYFFPRRIAPVVALPTICTFQTEPLNNITMGSLHDSRIHKWFATSPPVAWTIRQLRELLIGSLKQGPIPQHVAFVMDGNRRFARNHHIETVEGHNLGFESLARVWWTHCGRG
jgi:hypothetical protein